ncbi:endospore germination permease [Eubacteriales bacterium OttesenSCG-928-M02]|nr:endospore germination permease [Eubacteriales bacterium OttesenSCG-928-M02]
MIHEQISLRNTICLGMSLVISNSILQGLPPQVGQDGWISLLLSFVITVPMVTIYARILSLYPGMDLFDILERALGKWGGRIYMIIYTWYFFHLGALVLNSFSQFIGLVGLPTTPIIMVMAALAIPVLYLMKSGVGILGKWAGAMLFFAAITLALVFIFSLSIIDFRHFQPVFSHSIGELSLGAGQISLLPFLEIFVITGFAGSFQKQGKVHSPYRVLITASLVSAGFVLFIFIRVLGTLGPETLRSIYFPTYKATSIIRIGSFAERIESVVTFAYILSGITKISVCATSAMKGVAKLAGLQDYRSMGFPLCMALLALCSFVYQSLLDFTGFMTYYRFYGILLLVLLPLLLWVLAERRHKKEAKQLSVG